MSAHRNSSHDGASRWLRVILPLPPAGTEIEAVEALRGCGARAVERQGQQIHAWFAVSTGDDLDGELLRQLRAALRPVMVLSDADVAWAWQEHDAWATERAAEFATRRVGERIIVTAAVPADGPEPRPGDGGGDVVIRLHPGAGFGSAAHATTRACLRLLETLLRPGDDVLDIGTGNGILAIAAAKLDAAEVLALEADHLACEEAARNVALNGVADVVLVRQCVVSAADLNRLPPRDMVLANLECALLMRLLPGLRQVLARDARLVVAGITGGEWPDFLRAAGAARLVLRSEVVEDGWRAAALVTARADD